MRLGFHITNNILSDFIFNGFLFNLTHHFILLVLIELYKMWLQDGEEKSEKIDSTEEETEIND